MAANETKCTWEDISMSKLSEMPVKEQSVKIS